VNPNVDKTEHVLNIDDSDNRPSLTTVLSTALFYGLDEERGGQIIEDVVSAIDGWKLAAKKAGIARSDIELTGSAFSAHAEYRSGFAA
jgi:serine/threonine-protein kinase HipA